MTWKVSRTLADYFWARVDRRGPDECWEWTGTRYDGYGNAGCTKRPPPGRRAPRISYWLANGPFDLSLKVCHRCDNPPCVNPAHLFLGTSAQNTHDMIRKGRAGWKGASLTVDAVLAIRRSTEPQSVVAERYGVDQSTVSNIRRRKTWRHVEDDHSAEHAHDVRPPPLTGRSPNEESA